MFLVDMLALTELNRKHQILCYKDASDLSEIDQSGSSSIFPVKRLMNDAGGVFSAFLKENNIKQSDSNRYQANGIVERFNGSIKTLIERYVLENPNVNKFAALDRVLPLYNNTYHRTIT